MEDSLERQEDNIKIVPLRVSNRGIIVYRTQ